MQTQVQLGDIAVDVVRKDIKHVHLSVHPPSGRVRIAAPERMSLDNVRIFAISKLPWIKRQQHKMLEQERESPREYLNRESHYVWGRRYLLSVFERNQPPSVELSHNRLILRVRPGTTSEKKQAIVEEWYRKQVRNKVPSLVAKWERLMGAKVQRLFVQRMKSNEKKVGSRALDSAMRHRRILRSRVVEKLGKREGEGSHVFWGGTGWEEDCGLAVKGKVARSASFSLALIALRAGRQIAP